MSVDLYQENSSAGSDVKLVFGDKNEGNIEVDNILSFGDAAEQSSKSKRLGDKKTLVKLGTQETTDYSTPNSAVPSSRLDQKGPTKMDNSDPILDDNK